MLTADMVACAVVAAARELDEHPKDIEVPPTSGHTDFKSRYYAARMLVRRFPDIPRLLILRSLGYRTMSAASAGTKLAPSLQPKYFSDAIFDRCWTRFCDLLDRHVRVTDEPPAAPPVVPANHSTANPPPRDCARHHRLIDGQGTRLLPEMKQSSVDHRASLEAADYAAGKGNLRRMIEQAMANTPGARPV